MPDFWDQIDQEWGLESSRPSSSAPREPKGELNLAPSIDDPRTRGAIRRAFELSHQNVVAAGSNGRGRNNVLNEESFNLGQLVANGLVTRDQVYDHMMSAAKASGVFDEDGWGQCDATINSGLDDGIASGPRTNLPKMDPPDVQEVGKLNGHKVNGHDTNGREVGPGARTVSLKSFAGLRNRIPEWVWRHNGYGRMQLGTLTIFGGPAGTGKSTAARWFAAGFSQGRIPGIWEGCPVNVAYLAVEEDLDAMVRPSLEVAGADMGRLWYPKVTMDDTERILMSKADEQALTEELLEHDIRVLVLDPIMSTLGATVDIHRNNEVRDHLQPYLNIATEINGIALGIAHYRKSGGLNGVQALTGSAAFGEVARCVFGFMRYETGEGDENRVMSQSKNSAGREDLALEYDLEIVPVYDDEGRQGEVTRFRILGDSDVRVEDIMADGGQRVQTKVGDAEIWLSDYLQLNGPTPSKRVKDDARKQTEFGEKLLVRASSRLGVVITNRSEPGKPRVTYWALPPEPFDDADQAAADDGDRYWE